MSPQRTRTFVCVCLNGEAGIIPSGTEEACCRWQKFIAVFFSFPNILHTHTHTDAASLSHLMKAQIIAKNKL